MRTKHLAEITRIASLASSRDTLVNSMTCDIDFSSTLGAIRPWSEQQQIPFKRTVGFVGCG